MSVNKVIIVGNLGRDPNKRYMPSANTIASVIATYRVCRGQGSTGQKRHASAGPIAKQNATSVDTSSTSSSTTAPEGGDGSGNVDEGDGDGDADSDGPRQAPSYFPHHYPTSKPRNFPRASRRKSKPQIDSIVTMHAHGLLTLVLIFILTLAAAFGFLLLEYEGLAYSTLGLSASGGWALARCLVKPK